MRVVLRRTGLSPDLLRAWERRYGVVSPGRTGGRQRLYSEADVERLALLRRTTLYGHAISQIAELSNEELERLLATTPVEERPGPPASGDEAVAAVTRSLEAIGWMEGATLDAVLRQAALSLGPLRFAEAVLAPLVREVGERWHRGELRIVQEHLATSVIAGVVGSLMAFSRAAPGGPTLVSATTSGQQHELGAMMAAVIAGSLGWKPVFLGADLPGEEIALAADRLEARAVALSLVFPIEDPAIERDLTALATAGAGKIAIYAGGPTADHHHALLERLGIRRLDSLTALARLLREEPRATRIASA